MQAEPFTTTLSELNQLYGDYWEATEGSKPNVRKAVRAWLAYEIYARRYNRERGLDITVGKVAKKQRGPYGIGTE
jgi:hypothetical protein